MMTKIGQIVAFLVAISLTLCNGQFYNTRCNSDTQCDFTKFLKCFHGYCQCDSRSQIFDHSIQQCVLRPGAKCFNSGNHGNPNSVTNQRFMKCSKNSVCISSRCECQPGYSAPVNPQESICKANYQNSCTSHTQCDTSKGLACIQGSCQCQNSSLSYQGLFGCLDASSRDFVDMMSALKQTELLLRENEIDVDRILDDIDSMGIFDDDDSRDSSGTEDPSASLTALIAQSRQLFSGTATTINSATDLSTAAQQQQNAQTPRPTQGVGLNQIIQLIQSLGNLATVAQPLLQQLQIPRQSTSSPGDDGSGQNQDYTPQIPLITRFLNLFNNFIPRLRRFARFLNPFRFLQRLRMNFKRFLRGLTGGYGYGYPAASTTTTRKPKPVYGPPSPSYGPPTNVAATSITSAAPATNFQGEGFDGDFGQNQPLGPSVAVSAPGPVFSDQQQQFQTFQSQSRKVVASSKPVGGQIQQQQPVRLNNQNSFNNQGLKPQGSNGQKQQSSFKTSQIVQQRPIQNTATHNTPQQQQRQQRQPQQQLQTNLKTPTPLRTQNQPNRPTNPSFSQTRRPSTSTSSNQNLRQTSNFQNSNTKPKPPLELSNLNGQRWQDSLRQSNSYSQDSSLSTPISSSSSNNGNRDIDESNENWFNSATSTNYREKETSPLSLSSSGSSFRTKPQASFFDDSYRYKSNDGFDDDDRKKDYDYASFFDPTPLPLSKNKYPRQERFSVVDNDSSPYLPEHL